MAGTTSMKTSNVIGILQIITLVIGIVTISAKIGARDNQLKNNTQEIAALKDITTDLLRVTATNSANLNTTQHELSDIRERLLNLERKG